MSDFSSEKEIAAELSKLNRQVRLLRDEIRVGALPSRPSASRPALPTDTERRLRPLTPTEPGKKDNEVGHGLFP